MLRYIELHPRSGKPETVNFKRICPCSRNILEDRLLPQDNHGLTIIGLLDDGDFKQQLNRHFRTFVDFDFSFVKIKNMHTTLLGLFDASKKPLPQNTNPRFEKDIYDAVRFYIEQTKPRKFELTFNCIRPGTWRSEVGKHQVNECGDGTIIATGVISGDNKRFCDLGDELASYLKRELGYIFKPEFGRKYPNLWSTLGCFTAMDSEITNGLFQWFRIKRDIELPIKVEINKLDIVKYLKRTLNDMESIGEPLPLYPRP